MTAAGLESVHLKTGSRPESDEVRFVCSLRQAGIGKITDCGTKDADLGPEFDIQALSRNPGSVSDFYNICIGFGRKVADP